MAKYQPGQVDLSTITTQHLQNLFIDTAKASYTLKTQAQQGNLVAQSQYAQQVVFANGLWNIIKSRVDFDVNFGTPQDKQGMAHWSLELADNNLTKDIHEFGKTFPGDHALSFNHVDNTGRSTCFWAADYNNKDIVQYCLQNGAKIDIRDNHWHCFKRTHSKQRVAGYYTRYS